MNEITHHSIATTGISWYATEYVVQWRLVMCKNGALYAD